MSTEAQLRPGTFPRHLCGEGRAEGISIYLYLYVVQADVAGDVTFPSTICLEEGGLGKDGVRPIDSPQQIQEAAP